MDQLLVGHAGEQGHHGDLGVGSTQLLTRTQGGRLRPLEQHQHLFQNQGRSTDESGSTRLNQRFKRVQEVGCDVEHLVGGHVDSCSGLSPVAVGAAAVLPPVLRGRCPVLHLLQGFFTDGEAASPLVPP